MKEGEIMKKCLVCKKQIGENERALWLPDVGVICMGCEFKEITVYFVTLPGEYNGYYDKDIDIIVEMIADADFDSGYTIIKEKMKAIKYYSLPEFTGF